MTAIDNTNFCHIEQLPDGRRVLFYAEHDSGDIILHQITHCTIGTVDMKVKMPSAEWERRWPPNYQSGVAAMLSAVRDIDQLAEATTAPNTTTVEACSSGRSSSPSRSV